MIILRIILIFDASHGQSMYLHNIGGTVPLIRLVWFTDGIDDSCKSAVDTLSNDFKFTAEDLLGDDWISIDNL